MWLIPEVFRGSMRKPKLLHMLNGHMHCAVTSLAVHQNGTLLATGTFWNDRAEDLAFFLFFFRENLPTFILYR